MPRILVAADVVPRPAVEAAFLHVGDVVGPQVVAEGVAFVGRYPQFARLRMHDDAAAGVADAGGVDTHELSLGRELEDVCPVELAVARITLVDVRRRADADKHPPAVW